MCWLPLNGRERKREEIGVCADAFRDALEALFVMMDDPEDARRRGPFLDAFQRLEERKRKMMERLT